MNDVIASSPVGLHRVLAPAGVLPQAAERLDTRRTLADDEVRVRVERLNLDAASFRQLERTHGGDGDAVRAAVLDIVRTRGKMQNPGGGEHPVQADRAAGDHVVHGPSLVRASLWREILRRVIGLAGDSLRTLAWRARPRQTNTPARTTAKHARGVT